jgi:uncharacterized protein (DUF302 family)
MPRAEHYQRRQAVTEDSVQNEADVVTKLSPRSVADTVARLKDLLAAKNQNLFGVIDQRAAAQEVGLDLRDTTLVIFGSPAAGTPVMDAVPLSALDLPLKVLIWADGGQTKVSYYSPEALAARHHLTAELAARLAGINPLTDALVAP